jgi:penicillin-binding protein 2
MATDPFKSYVADHIRDPEIRNPNKRRTIDAFPPDQSFETGGSSMKIPAAQFPIRYLPFIVLTLCAIIIGRLIVLQVVHGADYREKAEGNRIQTHRVTALRGVIYGSDGQLLVKNIPNFSVVLYAREIANPTEERLLDIEQRISNTAGVSLDIVDEAMTHSFKTGEAVLVKEHIPYEEALRLMIETRDIPGTRIEIHYSREYLAGEAFSHALGYTSKMNAEEYEEKKDDGYDPTDDIGKIGIEYSYEEDLRGVTGYRNVEVDFRGRQQAIVSEIAAQPGNNIVLAVNPQLQNDLHAGIQKVVDEKKLSGGSAVAIDPRDGRVLAFVSYPSYDNNSFAKGIGGEEYQALLNDERNPLLNRPVSGQFPSGSTFKPVVAAAALEEGVASPSMTVLSTGGIRIGEFYFPDWKAGGHGVTDVRKALADSVNTYFYIVGGGDNEQLTGLGVERITEYARKFGLGETLGIDIPGEKPGFLPSKAWKEEYKNEPWYLGDTYHLAIGQGDILVTPLQVASYTATIASGGTMYQPHIVEKITDQQGNVVRTIDPVVKAQQVVSQSTMQVVREGMRQAATSGSARSLQILPVSSAAKTGTAQFGDPDKTHAWVTVFAPYENPEIAVTVLIEEGGQGSETATPIVREALLRYFADRSVQSQETDQ